MSVLKILFSVAILLSFSFFLSNCKKEKLNLSSSTKVSFSADSILFDTIFTTIGSTTKRFKIYNKINQKIRISNIWLEQGTSSMFRINVDGLSGVSFQDIEIEAKDSLYVFVEVTIDPNNANSPMVVLEKIKFITNGNEQNVVLTAWGQDAYFHNKEIITTSTTWANNKPHVIYNYCAVDSNVMLNIPSGTEIFSHVNATLLVYKGSLNCQGVLGNPIVFQQDRLEDYLLTSADSISGQWRGIRFFEAQNSQLDYVEVKNALIGIQVDTAKFGHTINLNSVKIHNSSYAGLLTQGGNVTAVNSLFGNAGNYSALVSIGGTVNFDHCTFGNHWQNQRNSALFVFKNYYEDANSVINYRPFSSAVFTNNIFYGPNENEFLLDTLSSANGGVLAPNVSFANCLIKSEDGVGNGAIFNNCFSNNDPAFSDPVYWDFSLASSSFAKGKANSSTVVIDIDGNSRSTPATLGCYE